MEEETRIEMNDYPTAIGVVLTGGRYQRQAWDSQEWIIKLEPDDFAPFIAFKPASGDLVPYYPTNEDIFAEDWQIIK